MDTFRVVLEVIVSLATLTVLIGGIFAWVGAKKVGDASLVVGVGKLDARIEKLDLRMETGLQRIESKVDATHKEMSNEIRLIHERINKVSLKQARLEERVSILHGVSLESKTENSIEE